MEEIIVLKVFDFVSFPFLSSLWKNRTDQIDKNGSRNRGKDRKLILRMKNEKMSEGNLL